jgi:hypothetical protein
MRQTELYQARAAEMARLGRRAASDVERAGYEDLAAAYERMAADAASGRCPAESAKPDQQSSGGD